MPLNMMKLNMVPPPKPPFRRPPSSDAMLEDLQTGLEMDEKSLSGYSFPELGEMHRKMNRTNNAIKNGLPNVLLRFGNVILHMHREIFEESKSSFYREVQELQRTKQNIKKFSTDSVNYDTLANFQSHCYFGVYGDSHLDAQFHVSKDGPLLHRWIKWGYLRPGDDGGVKSGGKDGSENSGNEDDGVTSDSENSGDEDSSIRTVRPDVRSQIPHVEHSCNHMNMIEFGIKYKINDLVKFAQIRLQKQLRQMSLNSSPVSKAEFFAFLKIAPLESYNELSFRIAAAFGMDLEPYFAAALQRSIGHSRQQQPRARFS